jgi:membrane-associated phospholipid phosphatase
MNSPLQPLNRRLLRRILDGSHWPSDVLASYALGLAWTIAGLVIDLPWATNQPLATDLTGATGKA